MINAKDIHKSQNSNVIHVAFRGDDVEVLRDQRGAWVPLKRVCEALGIDHDSQRKKLAKKPWAVTVMNTATGSDGKKYSTFCLHLDALPMWLATIEPGKVAHEVQEKLTAYQCECAKVLREAVFGGQEAPMTEEEELAKLRAEVRAEVRVRRMLEQEVHAVLGSGEERFDRGKVIGDLFDEMVILRKALKESPGNERITNAAATHLESIARRMRYAGER